MMPQPIAMFLVCEAITAVIAVEERASMPCLRHHGYASANQKMSNPARSQTCAMRTVCCNGSMLNCSTAMRKGTAIDVDPRFAVRSLSDPMLSRFCPRLFQPFDERPHRLVKGCWHTILLARLHNRPIHEVNFRRSLRQDVLQHAGPMLSRSICPFGNQIARIAVQS